MAAEGALFTSGDWRAKAGNEDEFISRWTEFVRWTKEASDGAQEFFLIRQKDDPHHFLSFGRWSGQDAVDAWRQSSDFGVKLDGAGSSATTSTLTT